MNAILTFFLKMQQSVRIAITILYLGCVAALSLLPMNDLPHVHEFRGLDKIVHFCMYFGLSGLLSWAGKTELQYSRFIYIIVSTLGWGMFMEIMQMEMHLGRQFSWFDMIANASGVFAGILVYIGLVRLILAK
jgi:VanZ family protein